MVKITQEWNENTEETTYFADGEEISEEKYYELCATVHLRDEFAIAAVSNHRFNTARECWQFADLMMKARDD